MSSGSKRDLQVLFLLLVEIPTEDRTHWLEENHIDVVTRNELVELLKFHDENSLAIDKGLLGHSTHATVERLDPRELHLQCPHCNQRVIVLANSLDETIPCFACGGSFSLVGNEENEGADLASIKLGRFELLSQLGEGAFGTVWKARDPELDRFVAIKVPRKGQLNPAEIEQFFREARSAAQLHHPNIVPIHEVGGDGSSIYIVSELVRGVDLSEWLVTNQLDCREASQLCRTIALALDHAHQQGVIHRDLKPSNIMIDHEGKPYLMDFGLAKREFRDITMTIDGQILGTPAYMSPEQAAGDNRSTDARTDIYSLGVLLFQLLTSELPYRGNAQMQMYRRQNEDAPDPRRLNAHIPRDLSTICLKCLEREPNTRYRTARDVADELGRFLAGQTIQARPIPAVARGCRLAMRNKAAALAAALTIFFAIVGPIFAINYRNQYVALQREKKQKESAILGNRVEKKGDAREIDKWQKLAGQLQENIDLKEGKANPWDVFPTTAEHKPRKKKLISKFYKRSVRSISQPLHNHDFSQLDSARCYFGLALLAEAIESREEAYKHYDLANQSLQQLIQESPNNPRFLRALALSRMYLSRCATEDSRRVTFDQLSSAGEIFKNLVASGISDASHKIALADVELLLAGMPDFTPPGDHLAQIAKINSDLDDTWPEDPMEIYKLACYLTSEYPILLE